MTFQLKKISKSVFAKKNLIFSQNIFSRDFFSFRKKICFEKKIPISIRNFLKIPKIALRKSCDKFKAVKNKESGFFYKFYQILVMCQVFLPLSRPSTGRPEILGDLLDAMLPKAPEKMDIFAPAKNQQNPLKSATHLSRPLWDCFIKTT